LCKKKGARIEAPAQQKYAKYRLVTILNHRPGPQLRRFRQGIQRAQSVACSHNDCRDCVSERRIVFGLNVTRKLAEWPQLPQSGPQWLTRLERYFELRPGENHMAAVSAWWWMDALLASR
jgi:hypothetical protein